MNGYPMIKVLVNVYACSPNMGSEPGMGWNWIVCLSSYCEMHIITEGEFRPNIEAWMTQLENKKLTEKMHFYWNPVNEKIRRMCWNQGDWRFYKYYKNWQRKTAVIARDICRKEHIDILHQLNMIGFREPGYLWQVSQETGIPFVWGPVDAKESFPMAYTKGASIKIKAFLHLKNTITKWQLKHSRRVHQAAETAVCVLSASSNSVESFRKYFSIDSLLMNETGTNPLPPKDISNTTHRTKDTFDILWVGKMDFRKQLRLAIKSVAKASYNNIRLHIVGSGDNNEYLADAEKMGIADNCIFYGSINHNEVLRIMRQSDLLLFTSVAEGTPHVVLEAISNSLPVLCFDTCGQGDCITDDIGFKIPLTNPKHSVKDFAEKIEYLYHHREELTRMSANCQKRAEELTWENKARQMVELYERIRE